MRMHALRACVCTQVDALTGERRVYRRRGVADVQMGAPQQLPKRVCFVLDVSASMYRFNGLDQVKTFSSYMHTHACIRVHAYVCMHTYAYYSCVRSGQRRRVRSWVTVIRPHHPEKKYGNGGDCART